MQNDKQFDPSGIDRRTFLVSTMLGASAAAVRVAAAAVPADAIVPASRELTAHATEGPYYLQLDLVRADITEGLAGIPLDIAFTVLDETGHAYPGASVDIWHCDAQGHYSGFVQPGAPGARGSTFLRGTQSVFPDGLVLFHSIYPGWYHGRTTHIHFKVKNGATTNLTSQLFLPDTLSEFLYTQVSTYRRTELRDTLNSTDGIAIHAGSSVAGSVRETNGRYLAALTVRVDRAAIAPSDRPAAFLGGAHPMSHGGKPPTQHGPAGPFHPPLGAQALQGDQRIAALLPEAPRVQREFQAPSPESEEF